MKSKTIVISVLAVLTLMSILFFAVRAPKVKRVGSFEVFGDKTDVIYSGAGSQDCLVFITKKNDGQNYYFFDCVR